MFAYIGEKTSPTYAGAIAEFSKLAVSGCVPCGAPAGHKDGWGTASWTKDTESFHRSILPANDDLLMRHTLTGDVSQGHIIIHLRKASIGEISLSNTHPFMHSGVAFCHNGSIKTFPKNSVFGNNLILREGQTDSEIFFLRILSRVPGLIIGNVKLEEIRDALNGEVSEIKNTADWTSLTCFISSSDGIVLNYLWNEQYPRAKELKMQDYYTFYVGMKGSEIILCSEKLPLDGFVWEKLENNTQRIFRKAF